MKLRGVKLAGMDGLRRDLARRARVLRRIAEPAKRYMTPAEVTARTVVSMEKLAATYQILANN
jgi:hypothetical protein